MPGIGLVHRGADNDPSIKVLHPLFRLLRRPRRLRQGHVEESLGRLVFVRAGSVHRSRTQRAAKWRSFLHDRLYLRGQGDDLLLLNEGDETIEGIAKTL